MFYPYSLKLEYSASATKTADWKKEKQEEGYCGA
jgi:hypothetical protein